MSTITTIDNTTIDTTTQYRTHWVEPATGIRYDSQWMTGPDGNLHKRDGLRPVINMDEVRAYVGLGILHLPGDASVPELTIKYGTEPGPVMYYKAQVATSVWYANLVLTGEGVGRTDHVLVQMAAELTDDVPRYAEQWRAPFVANRERFAAPPTAVQA